jgi:hypothetical protein
MKLGLEILKEQSIVLKRNRKEEINLNYKKIYDLSKIDAIENISFEEKKNLLITIKKILLSTNDYITSSNFLEIIRYFIVAFLIFVSYILIYCPIYKIYTNSNELQEPSLLEKIYCYFFFDVIEITFRVVFNNIKKKRVQKIMHNYAKNIAELQVSDNYSIYIDKYFFNLYIIPKSLFNSILNLKEEKIPSINKEKHNFYQYVINYPNSRYYNWDRKILNEKENEIANNVIMSLNLAEKEHVKKFGFSVIIVWAFYIFSFNSLIRGEKVNSLFYRFIIFTVTKLFSYIMSYNFKNILMEKEKIITKQYLPSGYFILLSFTVIQIFKLNDEYVNKTTNFDEIYKKLHKDILDLNEKILENY